MTNIPDIQESTLLVTFTRTRGILRRKVRCDKYPRMLDNKQSRLDLIDFYSRRGFRVLFIQSEPSDEELS